MAKHLKTVRLGTRRGDRAVERLIARGRSVLDPKTVRVAARQVEAVRRRGDAALLKAVKRYDGVEVESAAALRLEVPDPEAVRRELPPGFAEALERAIAAVGAFHRRQAERALAGFTWERDGVEIVEDRRPLARVGIYVPGGRASYPSTAVMTVLPALAAGVEQIAVATPPAAWAASPALRYALGRLGVGEVWGMGGAHAVAAFAYGTETVPRVDLIAGPGNAWVTAAKKLVAGEVAIDGLAGPSEVVIVAAGDADPALVAADLLAQAEHDPRAAAVLVTTDRKLPRRVNRELAARLSGLATAATASASLAGFGLAVVVESAAEALALVERIAPEHLQLVGAEAETLAPRVRNAGAVFVGSATPEVFGDYVAGPSHVLPTGGGARFASGLGVDDFVRSSHRVRFTQEAAAGWAGAAAALAEAEGFPAHAASARLRGGADAVEQSGAEVPAEESGIRSAGGLPADRSRGKGGGS
jgi:histidinol dehydrogenase